MKKAATGHDVGSHCPDKDEVRRGDRFAGRHGAYGLEAALDLCRRTKALIKITEVLFVDMVAGQADDFLELCRGSRERNSAGAAFFCDGAFIVGISATPIIM